MFLSKRDKGRWVPTLSGIIKAGDEGAYDSTFFDGFHGHPGEVTLENLLDAFARDIATQPMTERSTYSPAFSKFLAEGRRGVVGLRRSLSLKKDKDSKPARAPRKSFDLSEKGLSRSLSTKKKAPTALVGTLNGLPSSQSSERKSHASPSWTHDVQHAQKFEGKASISVTSEELAALSVLLGAPLAIAQTNPDTHPSQTTAPFVHGVSASAISIRGAPAGDGKYRVQLLQHKRSIAQLPSKGKGYSTLFAKHLAASSLPFSQDNTTVDSILITKSTYEAVINGTPLEAKRTDAEGAASQFLANLPSSKDIQFHTLIPSSQSTSTPLLLHSIAALPFSGGFTPLASSSVVETVRFVASAGLPAGRLLQRLEALVDRVHRQAKSLQLFGALYEDHHAGVLFREQGKLGKVATGDVAHEAIGDKVARMRRYSTLLERLMALVPGMKSECVLAAVREALKKELERSYADAVAASRTSKRDSGVGSALDIRQPPSHVSRRSSRTSRSKRSSMVHSPSPPLVEDMPTSTRASLDLNSHIRNLSPGSPRHSSTFASPNLGRQFESILKATLPLDVPTIATVARLILVAWTYSVDSVAWEAGDDGVRLPDLSVLPEKMVLS